MHDEWTVPYAVDAVRERFPALRRRLHGAEVAYLDGPGGTQVPEAVIAAMAAYLRRGGSNLHGPFVTSAESAAVVKAARSAVADLFGASPDEIVFGANMTTLTFAFARALARTWRPGDNVVVTRLDHDANVTPWVLAARDADVAVRWLDFLPEDGGHLDLGRLDTVVDERTRLVALGLASNALGTITDPRRIVQRAHAVGALVYADAVHLAPHRIVDVAALDVDFLVASAYKFCGPHVGCLYGRGDLLASVSPYKVRPAPDEAPDRWETGTPAFEGLAGVAAAVDHLASLGTGPTRRARLRDALTRVAAHERQLAARFLEGIATLTHVRLYGTRRLVERTPTFAVAVAGRHSAEVAADLARQGIFVWSGDYYAVETMRRLGVADHGGLVRIGFVHYNTLDEVDRVLAALARLAE